MSKRFGRGGLAVVALAALAGGGALVVTGSSAEQPLGPQVVKVTGPDLTVDDPIGAAPWRLHAYRHGFEACARVGRVSAGHLVPDDRRNLSLDACMDARTRNLPALTAVAFTG